MLSASENLDTESAMGRMCVNIMAVISQWERETIAERTRDALKALKARGKRTGTVPFGYWADEAGTLHRDDDESAVVDEARRLREREGLTYEAVAERLTAQGIRTRRGRAFSRQGVHHMLKMAESAGVGVQG